MRWLTFTAFRLLKVGMSKSSPSIWSAWQWLKKNWSALRLIPVNLSQLTPGRLANTPLNWLMMDGAFGLICVLITFILFNRILFHFHDLLWIHICFSVYKIEKQKQFTSITRKSGQCLAALSLKIKFAASFKTILKKNIFLFFFHDTDYSSYSYYIL